MTDSSQPTDPRQEAIIELLWNYLKPEPEGNKDRRATGYGGKTKQGLCLSVLRVAADPTTPPPPTLEQAAAAFVVALDAAIVPELYKQRRAAHENGQDFALPASQRRIWRHVAELITQNQD